MQIYKITNLINGMAYIGKSQDEWPYYMGSGLLLWNSYRKRFERNDLNPSLRRDHKWVFEKNQELNIYSKEILATCDDKHELCELEKYYINKYNSIRPNGYNIAEGGDGGCLISGYTEDEKNELRKKISDATKNAMQRDDVRERLEKSVKNKSEEWKKHISESLTGRKGRPMSDKQKALLRQVNLGNKYGIGNRSRLGMHNSEETNRKISEAQKKIKHTDEWNKKVSESLRGKPKTEEHKQKLRKPKPKYKWLLPDGTYRIMDPANASKHEGWIRQEMISS